MTSQRSSHRLILFLATLSGLVALSCSDADQVTCPKGLESFIEFNIYFGSEKGDGSEVSDAEWQAFLADEVTPRFPDGLTVFDARGQWLDTDADRLYREGTKVLNVLVPSETVDEAKQAIDEIADLYVEEFDQQVVFKTSGQACAGF